MYSVSQEKHNALKKENERLKEELEAEKVHSSLIFDEKNDLEAKLKELLSEDLVAENAKLKARISEMESENNVMALHIEDMEKEADEHRINYLTLFGELQTHLESIPKIKADAIRDAAKQCCYEGIGDASYNDLLDCADQLEQGK